MNKKTFTYIQIIFIFIIVVGALWFIKKIFQKPSPIENIELDIWANKTYKRECDSLADILSKTNAPLAAQYTISMYDDGNPNQLFFPYNDVQHLLVYDSAKGKLYEIMNEHLTSLKYSRKQFFDDVNYLQGAEKDRAYSAFKAIWPPLIDTSASMIVDSTF